MVLLSLLTLLPKGTSLPTWAYTYEVPAATSMEIVNGVVVYAAGGRGGDQSTAAKTAPAAPRLTDLVPDLAKTKGFALGDRLDRAYIERATKASDAPYFATTEGAAQIGYSLNGANRVQTATYAIEVNPADSEARFAAIRARLDQKLGSPTYGRRDGDEALTLLWRLPNSATATLGLIAKDGTLGMGVMLTDTLVFAPTTPIKKG